MEESKKSVILDETGRVTISKTFRKKIGIHPGDELVETTFDKFIILVKKEDLPKAFSFEFLYNKITALEKQNITLDSKLSEIRTMVMNDIMGKESDSNN